MAETPQQEIDRLVAVAVRREARHCAELEALGVPLGPDGRPDCGYCAERLKVNVGLAEENRQLRTGRLGRQIERASANVRASDAYKHRIDGEEQDASVREEWRAVSSDGAAFKGPKDQVDAFIRERDAASWFRQRREIRETEWVDAPAADAGGA